MTSLNRDLALPILENCFPGAANLRIINHEVEEGQRHFTSNVTRFTVEYEQNHVTRRKSVALKVPAAGAFLTLCESFNVYDREIRMYETMIPRINEYLDKSLSPAHLYTTDAKTLVLEDLTARGYKSGEKFPHLNLLEAKGAMKAFAHYHAASHKLYEKDAPIFRDFLVALFEEPDILKALPPFGPVVVELLKRKNEHRLLPKVEAALLYFEANKNKISTILDRSKLKFVALNHGDSRKDNFLFKYVANDEVQVQFVDYQCCFVGSPAYDVTLFLHGSVRADVLAAHFDGLIDGYLHELNGRLKKLDCASTYERTDFDKDFKSFKFFAIFGLFVFCATVTPMNRQQFEDLFDKSKVDAPDLGDLCLNDEQFVRAAYSWLKYFEKSKIINEF